jgi:hypothetical protein
MRHAKIRSSAFASTLPAKFVMDSELADILISVSNRFNLVDYLILASSGARTLQRHQDLTRTLAKRDFRKRFNASWRDSKHRSAIKLRWIGDTLDPSISMESLDKNVVAFRVQGELIIPYCELRPPGENKLLPIRSIWIGPRKHPELARKSLEMLLWKYGYYHGSRVEIKDSKIPLRSA